MTGVDLLWLALNAYHEAKGEPFDGQVAVCHATLNRAVAKRKTVKEIVLEPWQFSWANEGKRPPIIDYSAFESCMKLRTGLPTRIGHRETIFKGQTTIMRHLVPTPSRNLGGLRKET